MAEPATATPRIVPLDPQDPKTWINIPAPDDTTAIQAELTRIGELNRYGRPNFIIIWAQEYRTFDLGRNRIHFDEQLIDAIHRPVRWAVRDDVYIRAQSWFAREQKRRTDNYMNLRWSDFAAMPPDVSDYLRNNEPADNYFKLPSDTEDLGRLARLLPDGWKYINGHHTYEHIGQQCYYVLQWFGPEAFNEKEWSDLRFDRVYCPETDSDEYIDVNGPFPSEGQYENVVFRVCTRDIIKDKHPNLINETVDREICRYLKPSVEYCADRLNEMIRIRANATAAEKDSVKRTEQRFKDFREQAPTRSEKFRKHFREIFRDARPVGGGNPTNISSNKTKFDN